MSISEKYISEALMKDKPKIPIGLFLRDKSVTTRKLDDEAVTEEKLAENSVSTDKIIDHNVTWDKLTPETQKVIEAGTGVDGDLVHDMEQWNDRIATLDGKITAEQTRAANAENALDGRVDTLEEAVSTGGSVDSKIASAVATETSRAQEAEANRYTKNETYTKEEVNNLITTPNQEYVSVTATDQTTAVTDVLPATGAADRVYRVGNWDGSQYDAACYSEYAWNGSAYVHLGTKTQIGEVFDISAYHATGGTLATYDDINDALGTNGKNIPQSLRKGGMSVKFVQTSDNKYVQYRLTTTTFSVDVTKWKCVENEIGDIDELIYQKINFPAIAPILYFTGETSWVSYESDPGQYYTSKIIPLSDGVKYIRITTSATITYLYLLKSGNPPKHDRQTPDFATGETKRREIPAGTTEIINIPSDCTYIAVGDWAGQSVLPSKIEEASEIITIVESIKNLQESTVPAVVLASQLQATDVISETDIVWTDEKGLLAIPSLYNYNTLVPSSLLKTSEYIALKKGIITFTIPTYEKDTTFGCIFYDDSKTPVHNVVIEATGSYGSRNITIENTNYSFGRFVWFSSNEYGTFQISTNYFNLIDKNDVKEITKNFVINGEQITITDWISNKGQIVSGSREGNLGSSTLLDTSDYIDVSNCKSISLKLVSYEKPTDLGYAWFDSNKQYIQGVKYIASGEYLMYDSILDIPEGASFIRTSKLKTYSDAFVITKHYFTKEKRVDKVLIAASDSSASDKANASFVCSGTNDEIIINRAFSSLRDLQDLYFAKGTYYIDSFFESSDGEEDYVICYPQDALNRHNLICEGAMPTKTSSSGIALGTFINTANFVITSNCYENLDSSKTYSIIRCNSNNGQRRYTANMVQVSGLSFVIPDNQKKIICIDAKYGSSIQVEKVMASAVANVNSLKIPVDGCIAIRGVMGSNYGTGNFIRHCFVWGFNEGYAISGEHLICTDLGARFCNYGFTFNNYTNKTGTWTHPITMINCADELNFNMPLFGHNGETGQTDNLGGRQAITFIDFNLEWLSSYYRIGTGHHAKELTPGEWYGEIYYTIQTSYGGNSKNSVDTPFWANDGSGVNIKSVNQAQLQRTTSAILSTYAPNYNQVVYVTDLNKPLICTNPETKEWRDFVGNVVSL